MDTFLEKCELQLLIPTFKEMLCMLMIIAVSLCFSIVLAFPFTNNVCREFEDYATIATNRHCYYNPDVDSSPAEIARRYGYPFESHKVKTEDGYILTLFRIPHNKTDSTSYRQPVVLQHGAFASAVMCMLLGENSLAFFLVNNGYDVWLANFRGSEYSTGHENSAITEKDYWNFSFHEVGIYDLPTYIEFISKATGKNKDIIYVGHSMGTTAAFVYASLRKDHAEDNLKGIIALAPVAYLDNVQGLVSILVQFSGPIKNIFRNMGFYGVGQLKDLQRLLAKVTCNQYPLIIFCQLLIASAAGLVTEQLKPETFPLITSYLPAGTAVKTLNHFSQMISSHGRFQFYDYGPSDNIALYNSTIPPEYPVENISIPVHLFLARADLIAESQSFEKRDKWRPACSRGGTRDNASNTGLPAISGTVGNPNSASHHLVACLALDKYGNGISSFSHVSCVEVSTFSKYQFYCLNIKY